MNLLTIFGQDYWLTKEPASMDNAAHGYFWATQDYVEHKGILPSFLDRARKRNDRARGINDLLLASEHSGLRSFLVQRKSNGVELIHAEFLLLRLKNGSISGPVATSVNPNRDEVRAKHMVMVARLCSSPEFKEGEHYAFTVPNDWGADRALREFGFDPAAAVDIQLKGHLYDLIGGAEAILSVQKDPTVPASIQGPKPAHWLPDFEFAVDAGIGPHASIRINKDSKTSG